MKKILLIGGDSRLGKIFYAKYKKNFEIYRTRKKKGRLDIFLDLKNIEKFKTIIKFDYVLFIAGVVDYTECEKNFNYAKKINCINIPRLAKNFLIQEAHIIFISTNTVFKYKKKIPNENDKTCPGFNYAKLKDMTEKKLLLLKKDYPKITILRLTKNIDKNTAPFNKWINDINKSITINAFKDLFFAPILFEDSAKLIFCVIKKNLYGIYHLSGEKDLNYCEFAKLLIKKKQKKLKAIEVY